MGAMLLSLAIPLILLFRPADQASVIVTSGGSAPIPMVGNATVSALESPAPVPPVAALDSSRSAPLDSILLVLWGLGSLAVTLMLLRSAHRLARERRGWGRGTVSGVPVLLSRNRGPAVVGLLRPRIVLPQRVLDWDAEAQRLVLMHEREHQRARDPLLLACGWLAVALVPWNPALCWQLGRLRLATEIDCDARVLRARADLRRYARLLLEVGGLAPGVPGVAVAFGEPRSFLERRIRAMTPSRSQRPIRGLLAPMGVCAMGILAACALPVPERPELDGWHFPSEAEPVAVEELIEVDAPVGEALEAVPGRPLEVATEVEEVGIMPVELQEPSVPALRDTIKPRLLNPREVREALIATYPQQLREAGISDLVVLELQTDERGRVRDMWVVRASDRRFADAAQDALAQADFSPAMIRGRPVPFRFTMPLEFALPLAKIDADLPTLSTAVQSEIGVPPIPPLPPGPPPAAPPLPLSAPPAPPLAPPPPTMAAEYESAIEAYNTALEQYDAAAMRQVAEQIREQTEAVREQTEAMRGTQESMRQQTERMREEAERMRMRSEEMRRNYERMQRVISRELGRQYPEIVEQGLPAERYVWFLADQEGNVLRSGIGRLQNQVFSSDLVEREIRSVVPDSEIGPMFLISRMDVGDRGRHEVNVAWITLASGSEIR